MKNCLKFLVCYICIFILFSFNIYAEEVDVTKNVSESLDVDSYLEVFEKYVEENNLEEFSPKNLYLNLVSGEGIDYKNILDTFVSNLVIQVKESMNSAITIFVIIIVMAILSSLELDKNSDIVKISSFWQRSIYDIRQNERLRNFMIETFRENKIFYSSDLCGTDFKQAIDFEIRR